VVDTALTPDQVVQLPLLERWEIYDHTTVILAAVRILPMGLAAFLPAIVVT
jgi:hypothetical protein